MRVEVVCCERLEGAERFDVSNGRVEDCVRVEVVCCERLEGAERFDVSNGRVEDCVRSGAVGRIATLPG